jgi:rhodanese-related sulfurtransferase
MLGHRGANVSLEAPTLNISISSPRPLKSYDILAFRCSGVLLLRIFYFTMEDITVQELKQRLDNGDKFVFIDVREPYEYEEFNLGAKLIPLGDLMNRAWELDDHKNDEIIMHCRSGGRSGMAKQMLESLGFTKVRNTLGGVLAWLDAHGK